MSILTESGRIAIAVAVKNMSLMTAWGPGDGVWVDRPPEDPQAVALVDEYGRRVVNSVDFVVPDENGTFEVAGIGKFSVSVEPTKRLMITTVFHYDDEPGGVIRQTGIFLASEPLAGLPVGQRYFTPGQLQSPGQLLQLQNMPKPIPRDSEYRTRLENLIVF